MAKVDMRRFSVLTLLVLQAGLSGCVSMDMRNATVTTMVMRSARTAEAAPDQTPVEEGGQFRSDLRFRSGYRERIAFRILLDYAKGALGPAEISKPTASSAIFGASNRVVVRYPVSPEATARQTLFVDPKGPPRMRCWVATLHTGVSTFGATLSTIGRPKIDPETCGDRLEYGPFPELEAMLARKRQCEARGEKECVVYNDTAPAEPRRRAEKRP